MKEFYSEDKEILGEYYRAKAALYEEISILKYN